LREVERGKGKRKNEKGRKNAESKGGEKALGQKRNAWYLKLGKNGGTSGCKKNTGGDVSGTTQGTPTKVPWV